jgi:hypothetical protein
MHIKIRRTFVVIEERREEAGRVSNLPLRKDGMTLVLADAPMPDEVAVIFCLANRGRLNARVGGLSHEDVAARKATKQAP